MKLPEVKICGVCTPEDAALAGEAGAAYVGVILARDRDRTLSFEEAADVLDATTVKRVGVFADEVPARVLTLAERLHLDVVQLHGAEPAGLVALLAAECSARVWKAVAVRSGHDARYAAGIYADMVDGLLLDGWSPISHGGVGASFDWEDTAGIRDEVPTRVALVVAGGLTAENVAGAARLLRPDVVDVSSGVEATVRRKSEAKVRAFIAAARAIGGAQVNDGG